MTDNVSPKVRKGLVECNCLAMAGQYSDAVNRLEGLSGKLFAEAKNDDALATAMLAAELRHLHDEDPAGADYFDAVIVPHLAELAPERRIIAEYNRAQFDFALFRPIPHWSSLTERARAIGFELYDARGLFHANEDAVLGKHREALPGFWRELVRTYRQGCWHVTYWAAARLAREYLQVGFPQEASWYAVFGLDDKVAASAGKDLLTRRDAGAIRAVITKLVANANLHRHFAVACGIIATVADSIPDDLIDAIGAWLLPRCSLPEGPRLAAGPLARAWQALGAIGHRLSPGLARRAAQAAVHHPKWNAEVSGPDKVVLEREYIVGALDRLVTALQADELGPLADHALPLGSARMLNHDYADVVNLLCHIAQRGGESLRARLGDRLFPEGRPVTYLLGQVATVFGKQFLPPDRLARAADEVARFVRLQVQRLPEGGEPVDYLGRPPSYNAPYEGGRIVVSIPSGVELEAVCRQRKDLTPGKVSDLVHAILGSLCDRENLLVNRVGLIKALGDLADSLSDADAEEVAAILGQLARGEIVEPTNNESGTESGHPFSAFTSVTGRVSSVRGAALVSLAKLGSLRPQVRRELFEGIFEEALADLDPDVRRHAFMAAQVTPRLSEEAVSAVLQGLRDEDPNSAAAAFYVLCRPAGFRLTKPQWRLFLYASKMATRNPSPNLRAAAASAASKLALLAPSEALKARVLELVSVFRSDVSFKVREACASLP